MPAFSCPGQFGSERILRAGKREWRPRENVDVDTPAQISGLRSSPRSSNAPMTSRPEMRWAASEWMSDLPFLSQPMMTVRRLSRPSWVNGGP